VKVYSDATLLPQNLEFVDAVSQQHPEAQWVVPVFFCKLVVR
jgi:hypothetical protein